MKRILILLSFLIGFSYQSYSQTSSDADAFAFINACNADPAGQLTVQQKNYVTQLVEGLKAIGIWTKMTAVYPFVGGTAFKHKFNLKDPRDLDAAFRLTFTGGVHNSNGWVGNSSNRFANTFINANVFNVNSSGFGLYTNTLETSIASGPSDIRSGGSQFNGLILRTNTSFSTIGTNLTTNNLSSTNGNLLGFTLSNKINNSHLIYNKSVNITISQSTSININNNGGFFYIGGDPVVNTNYTNKAYQLIIFHNGLTQSESERLSHLIYYLQGILQRQ